MSKSPPIKISISDLMSGATGLSPGAGYNAAEAAAVCLDFNSISTTVEIQISGHAKAIVHLEWERPTDQVKHSHADMGDAAKDGAVGLAALCAPVLFEKRIFSQSYKGTGFDYFLRDSNSLLFQEAWGYEISGLLCEPEAVVHRRVKQKQQQVERGRKRGEGLAEVRVFVMEFSTPLAKTSKA